MLNIGAWDTRAGLTMPRATRTRLALLGLAALCAPPTGAASFDCSSRWLTLTERTICDDQQLSQMDDRLARRLGGFARRLNFGQYLGLRHWHASAARQRNLCRADRACIAGRYRAQARFLDRLQSCVESSLVQRACLREVLSADRASVRP
jgi:uncharacterized protein